MDIPTKLFPMKVATFSFLCTGLACLGFSFSPLKACTSLVIGAKDGGYVYGRTMEFGVNLNSNLIIIPRNYSLTASAPGQPIGTGGKQWRTKYGATGTNFFGMPRLCEGINEKGLTGGLFYFPEFAEFQELPEGKAAESISNCDLVTYVLTNFATTDEIKSELPKVIVTGISIPALGDQVPPVHFSFHDAEGKSVVIEYTDGGILNIYDNPTTVLTNAPSFPEHLNTLSQYALITRYTVPALQVSTTKLAPMSTGLGSNTLPGGYMSPARFVRAYFTAASAPETATSEELVPLVFHFMNGYDIPPGLVGQSAEGITPFKYEITEWTSSVDMKNLRYHIRTFDNSQVRYVDLNAADLDATEIRTVVLDQKEIYTDLSK